MDIGTHQDWDFLEKVFFRFILGSFSFFAKKNEKIMKGFFCEPTLYTYSDPYARSGDYISIAVGPQLRLQVMSELPAGR